MQENLSNGRMPPQARDVEEAVLGAILLEKNAFDKVNDLLNEDCFYVDAHRRVFKAMQTLTARYQPIDLLTVQSELGVDMELMGGMYFLTRLTNAVVSSTNIEHHCRIVLQKAVKRKIIEISGELMTEGFEDMGDAFDLLENAENQLTKIRQMVEKSSYIPLDSAMVETYQNVEKLRHRENHLTGVTSGFLELDRVTCGWQPTDLIILAARPSVGKTALALSLARNAAMMGNPVGFFSLEMSYRQLTTRILSSESSIPMWMIRNAKMNDEDMKKLFEQGLKPLSKAKIFIDDTSGIKISELKSKARRMVNREGAKIIIIDYLQLIAAGQRFDRKDLEVGFITSQLKGLAKDLNVPVICLSQLSRDVEKRGQKEPVLSDLRESGAIEQDADIVMFLWRTEEEGMEDMINVKIEKHRNGSLETFLGKFLKETQKWDYLKVLDKKTFEPLGERWKPFKD